MMNARTKKVGFTLTGLLLALVIGFMLFPAMGMSAKAYDGLPSEFGNTVGDPITVGSETKFTYVNYQGGYVKYNGETAGEPDAAIAHVGGKNVNEQGEEITSNAILEYILARDAFDIADNDLTEVSLVYGAGWTEDTKAELIAKFKAKYTELYNAAEPYVAGVPSGKISAWRHDNQEKNVTEIKMDFRYGDGTAYTDDGSGGRVNRTTLIYNVVDDEIRLLNTDKIYQKFEGEHRRLGAPKTEAAVINLYGKCGEGNFNIAEAAKLNVTAQIYETGIIYIDADGNAQKLEGLPVKRAADTWEIMPVLKDQDVRRKNNNNDNFGNIGDLDGTWHPLLTAREVINGNEMTVYYNYVPGCVEVVYNADLTAKSVMRYHGYRFVKNGNAYEREVLPVEIAAFKDDILWQGSGDGQVENAALNFYKSYNSNATRDDVRAAFKAGYTRLYNTGFVPGYRCSNIKMWDLMVLDFKYGDGTTGFDSTGSGGRERMTTLVYSPIKNAVYGVHDEYFNIFKNDSGIGRKVTGAPMSDVLKNHTFDGKEYEEIQFYEQGYLYKEGGIIKSFIGATAFDDGYAVKSVIPAPEVPGDYGAKIAEEKSEDGKITYINYRYGAVKATTNKANTACVYDYYHGRNFEFSKTNAERAYLTVYLLPVTDFLGEDGSKINIETSDNGYRAYFASHIKPKLVEVYTSYYNQGFFLGFLEGNFKNWNGPDGQQFRWGDSTACPFDAGRKNISLLAFNKTYATYLTSEEEDEFYIVKDAFMDAWASAWLMSGGIWSVVGVPTSNPYQIEGCDAWFQDYLSGTTPALVIQGTSMGISYYTDGTTAQQYVDNNKITYPEDSGKIPDTDVTYKEEYTEVENVKGCGSNMAASGSALAGGLLLLSCLGFVAVRKTKKKSN